VLIKQWRVLKLMCYLSYWLSDDWAKTPYDNKQNHWRRKFKVTIMEISVCFSWAVDFYKFFLRFNLAAVHKLWQPDEKIKNVILWSWLWFNWIIISQSYDLNHWTHSVLISDIKVYWSLYYPSDLTA